MAELTDATVRLYHEGFQIIPWLLLVLLIVLILYYRKDIRDYIQEKAKAQKSLGEREGERLEVMRNNTAALQNSTAALEMFKQDRDKFTEALEHHETLSKERFDRLQQTANQSNSEIIEIEKEISVISERVNR